MPRAYLMSWEGEPYFRWVKMHKGTRYRVGCHELNLLREQWTKEASATAANHWWTNKIATIQAEIAALHPHAQRLDELTTRLDYTKRHGIGDEAEIIEAELLRVRGLPPHDENDGYVPPGSPRTITRATELEHRALVAADVWDDRLQREHRTPHEATIGGNVDRYVKDRRTEAVQGVRSHESADAINRALHHFTELAGGSSPVEAITYELWQRWFVHCQAKIVRHDKREAEGWSADTASKYFTTARAFVRDLVERDILSTPPKNLTSKRHKFERPHRDIPTYSNDEVKQLVSSARGVHRLILLLMLNCGMTQKDVADLRRDQIDVAEGRITRRRSKTARRRASRLVSYVLWPETLELLTEHVATDGELALVTKSGKPWVWTETTESNGKLKMRKSDNVATVFNNLKKKLGVTAAGKSVKVFRKTSATRIKGNPKYRDLRFWFLGHSERTITDRHYADNTQAQLDEAVKWLATEYGL